MRESPVANRRPGNRRKPPIEDRELERQCRKDRQLFLREVIHDLLRVLYVPLLIEIALNEALHVGGSIRARVAAENLQVHGGKMVIGIGIELALKISEWLGLDLRAGRIRITQLA